MVIGLALALVYDAGRAAHQGDGRHVCGIHPQRAAAAARLSGLLRHPTVVDLQYGATTSFVATLSVYAGAYLVEIFRAGLSAIPRGLIDAGKAIGLTPYQRLRPCAAATMFRVVLPSLSNTFVSLFKDTSVASVLAVPELTYGAQWINFNTFRIVEVYAVVTPMYLVAGYAILGALRQLERRFAVR